MADADRCVMCGEIIPEGTQVCIKCSRGAEMENEKPTLDIDPEKLERLVEATKRVWVAVKEMTEVIVAEITVKMIIMSFFSYSYV